MPDAPGSYSYFCIIHPSMRGVVVVAAAGVVPVGEDPDNDQSDEEVEDVAAPPPRTGDFSPAALVGAIVLLLIGGMAILVALRGRTQVKAD
jgi:hypothetical protein